MRRRTRIPARAGIRRHDSPAAAGALSPGDAGEAVFFQLEEFAGVIHQGWLDHLEHAAHLVADAVPTESRLLSGTPAEALEAEAEKLDLLVVGSRDYGPLRRVMLGSASSALVRSAACPVLVVPRGAVERETAGRPGGARIPAV